MVADVRRRGVWIAAAVAVVAVVAIGVWGALRATEFERLARAGRADASAAIKSLSAKDAGAATASFQKAGDEFDRARGLLGPELLHGVPWLGRQLAAADGLAAIGAQGSDAGEAAAQLLVEAARTGGDDRIGALLKTAQPQLDAALSALVEVSKGADGLSTDGLVPPLADAVTQLQGELEPLRPMLARSESLLALERYLFSGQHRFLVLAQNNVQIRATGGFPGTYGLVDIGPGGFHLRRFADVLTLPRETLNPPFPSDWHDLRTRFDFYDGNWWLDFPTSASAMVAMWQSMSPAQPAVDGVIAIDLPTIRGLLEVFGPISVPESKVALTADNVVEQLSYTVEIDKSGGQGEQGKKNVVVSMARAVMDRLTSVSAAELLPTVESLAQSANEKHIQLYLAQPDAQAALVASGWSGAIAPPEATTDVVGVANSIMRRPAKANLGVSKRIDYDVRLQSDGSAQTKLELGYTKSRKNPLGDLQDRFNDHVRVNRAAGTVLTGGKGVTSSDDPAGLAVHAADFTLPSGSSASVVMSATVPAAVQPGAVPASGGATAAAAREGSWHYRLLLAKQADLQDSRARVTVTVPDGWRIAGSSAWFRVSTGSVPTLVNGSTITVDTPLTQDLVLDVALTRA